MGPATIRLNANEDHCRERERQSNRRQPDLPPRASFVYVVGAIQAADNRDDRGGAAPDGAEDSQGEDSAAICVRQAPELFFQEVQDLGRSERSQSGDDLTDKVRQRKETGEREQEKEGGE